MFVPLNKNTEDYVLQNLCNLLKNDERVLGVCYRFGGHAKKSQIHGNGHPIQPEIEDLGDVVEKRMNEWNMHKIFFTSDSIESVEYFQNRFGDKLIVMPRIRQSEAVQLRMKDSPMYCEKNIFQTSVDYLTEMELLARCNALIGSITTGLRYAVVKNNMKYEHCEILERGFFEDRRRVNRTK